MNHKFCVFIHIHKTAGTALRAAFQEAVPDQLLWYRGTPSKVPGAISYISSLDNNDLRDVPTNYKLFGGHFTVGKLPEVIKKNATYLAVMRDPIARAQSLYAYVQASPKHAMHSALKGMTLLQALDHRPFLRSVSNGQINALSPDGDMDNLLSAVHKLKYIVGKQEELPFFLSALEKHAELKVGMPTRRINAVSTDYKQELLLQKGIAEAVTKLKLLNDKEQKFFDAFDKVLISESLFGSHRLALD